MTLALILSILTLVMSLVLFSSIRIHCHYERRGEDDQLIFGVTWLRYLTYSAEIPLMDLRARFNRDTVLEVEAEGEQKEFSLPDTLRMAARNFNRFHRSIKYAFGRTKIKRLEWSSEFGVANAANTGLLAGLAWSLKGSVLSAVSAYSQLQTVPRIAVRPNFKRPLFHTLLDCIFEIRIGHIMIAGLKAVRFR